MRLPRSITLLLLALLFHTCAAEAHSTEVGAGTIGSGLSWNVHRAVVETLYVNNQSGSDAYDGSSSTSAGGGVGPKRTIAGAIAAASDSQTISVAYTGMGYDSLNTGAKSLRFTSTSGSPTLPNIMIASATTLDGPFTLAGSGTLTLSAGVLTGAHNLTIDSGGTLVRTGGSLSPGDSPIVTTYNLVYRTRGPVTSTSDEFVSSTTAVSSLTISDSGTVLTLHADRAIGSFILSSPGGGIVLGSSNGTTTLNVTGDVSISAGMVISRILTAAVPKLPTMVFKGTRPQTMNVPLGELYLPDGIDANNDGDFLDAGDTPPVDITINNLSSLETERVINLVGGNIMMGRGSTVWLESGLVVTGSSIWTLAQGKSPATNEPTQGFSRSSLSGIASHFVGNVRKYVDSYDSLARSKVCFPVGTPASSRACYRPLSFYFKKVPGSASLNITVSHEDSRPSGMFGFPIVFEGITITDYADFYWFVRSDISIAPSSPYDLEAQAEGYSGYIVDRIQNVRLIRRSKPDVNPEWVLVKGLNGALYENSIIASDWPVVKSISSNGGITTQGSIFTFGQSNGGPFVVTLASSNLTSTTATLNGVTYVTGLAVTVWFEWGTSGTLSSYNTTASQSPDTGKYLTPVAANLTGLSPGTTYFYRLAGKDTGEVQRGVILSFTTKTLPAQLGPTLLSPADTASNVSLTPTLSWNPLDGASYYELQVSPFFSFMTLVYDDTTSGLSRTIGPLNAASKYFWRVRGMNGGGLGPFSAVRSFMTTLTSAVDQLDGVRPMHFALSQNYPNPFNPSTAISFALPERSNVTLKVFDLLGKEVSTLVSQELGPGHFTVKWQADVPSGTYIYRLQAGEFLETKKMLLLH